MKKTHHHPKSSAVNNKKTDPIDKKEKVQQSNDKRIDEDFKGYPHNPAKEEVINPKTRTEKITANVEKKGQK
jgi:hypothetical protein